MTSIYDSEQSIPSESPLSVDLHLQTERVHCLLLIIALLMSN